VQEQSVKARAGRDLDGERRTEHERQPVLHHARGIRQGDEMVKVKVAD
jgi:hypothetical protein